MRFTRNILTLDPATEAERIVQSLQRKVQKVLRRHGGVVGISGG